MKIAYLVWDASSCSGGMRVIFEQANRLIGRGHQVEIWYDNRSQTDHPFACEVPFYYWHSIKEPRTDVAVITDMSYLSDARSKIKAERYYFLAQHDLEATSELSLADAQTAKAAALFNNFPSWCRIISVSSWVKERLLARYGLTSIVIPDGVNRDLFRPTKPLLDFTVPSIMYFYDAQNWKGFADACAAMSVLSAERPVRAVVIGSYMPKLFDGEKEIYYSFSWPVAFFNRPDQSDLARMYSSATVFVSPSWIEGFGLPGLEAMACGVPVVTTDSGGVREYAEHEKNCLMVPPKDHQAMANAVKRILDDKQLKRRLVKGGLETAKEFSWERSINMLEKALNI